MRVAFFTDSFHEVNGVALTSREFVAFTRRRSIPCFSVHAGPETRSFEEGSVTTWEFKRGPVRWNLEHDLAIDFLFLRYRKALRKALEAFRPDLVHITGPGDAGILGAFLAYDLKVPLAASWHTNLHEFAARRLERFIPPATAWTERWVLARCLRFYRLAHLLFAPNPELVDLLHQGTKKPAFLMERGIDTHLFNPARRTRTDSTFVIGYVGRLSPEKNVRIFPALEQALIAQGLTNYRFLLVGEGSERQPLREALKSADLPGVRRGEALAEAYASMDVLVFPSQTDTFGNVVLESMASGVPPIVTSQGGPKFLVKPGETGYIADEIPQITEVILQLHANPTLRSQLSATARQSADRYSWDSVFSQVHTRYQSLFPSNQTLSPSTKNLVLV